MADITAADILAAGDVVDQLAEVSDEMSFELTVELDEALAALARKVAGARGLLTTRQLQVLEAGAKTLPDGRVFVAVPDFAERFDHDAIGQAVVDHAVRQATDTETGEIIPKRAAEAAVAALLGIYTAPATKAKVTPLKELVDVKKVRKRENKGRRVQVLDSRIPEDDDDA